jgi:hypothetical protein
MGTKKMTDLPNDVALLKTNLLWEVKGVTDCNITLDSLASHILKDSDYADDILTIAVSTNLALLTVNTKIVLDISAGNVTLGIYNGAATVGIILEITASGGYTGYIKNQVAATNNSWLYDGDTIVMMWDGTYWRCLSNIIGRKAVSLAGGAVVETLPDTAVDGTILCWRYTGSDANTLTFSTAYTIGGDAAAGIILTGRGSISLRFNKDVSDWEIINGNVSKGLLFSQVSAGVAHSAGIRMFQGDRANEWLLQQKSTADTLFLSKKVASTYTDLWQIDTNGNLGIMTAPATYVEAAVNRGVTVSGTTGANSFGVVEMVTQEADATGNIVGCIQWTDKNSANADKRVVAMYGKLYGTTATKRGGVWQLKIGTDNVSGLNKSAYISSRDIGDTTFGYCAGKAITLESANTLFGNCAGEALTSSYTGNVLLGHQAGKGVGSGTVCDIYIGYQVGSPNGSTWYTSEYSVVIGYRAYSSGNSSIVIGQSAYSTGTSNCVIGRDCNDTSGGSSIVIGTNSSNTGVGSIIIGLYIANTTDYATKIANVNLAAGATAMYCDPSTMQIGTTTSLRKFKTNIREISHWKNIYKVKPIIYDFNELSPVQAKDQIGLIAEDLLPLFPELCAYIGGELKTIHYEKVGALLIKPIQDHESRIKALELENKKLKAELAELKG